MKGIGKIGRLCLLAGIVTLLTACGDDPTEVVPSVYLPEVSGQSKEEAKDEGVHKEIKIEESLPQIHDSEIESSENESSEAQKESSEAHKESVTIIPETVQDITITISAVGDVTLGNYRDQGYEGSFRQTYGKVEDKGYFFENVAEIFREDDMTIANLEGTLTFSEEYEPGRTYNIKGDPEYAFLLSDASVEAVSMANNHRLDYGENGSKDTVASLEEAGVAWAYERNLGFYDVKDIRIGWVSVNEASQGKSVERFLEEGIAKLREEGAQLVLACCHWGTEKEYYPEEYQRELGRKCIDWGADLVIGHHPHVLQGIERYEGRYIVYSLGNFCFGANKNPSDKDTMIFQQTFIFREGELLLEEGNARVIPCRVSSVTTRNDFKPTPLDGEEGQRVLNRINEFSKEFGISADSSGKLMLQTQE